MTAMQISEVVPWGRSFAEYRRMFDLTPVDLAGTVLGCGDGPASFNAEATARGHSVVSCDPIYQFSADQIRGRVEACCDTVVGAARRDAHRFVWDAFKDAEDLGRARLAAMHRFLADFERGRAEGRYVVGSLPALPFADGQFDLCLCSHLLFLYSDQLDLEFHRASAWEMLRVAREVRIFPLLDLEGKPSPHVDPIQAAMRDSGLQVDLRAVPYEFQKGGDRMMVVTRA
jgi:hypothetical protein